jgi:hypothetical protein
MTWTLHTLTHLYKPSLVRQMLRKTPRFRSLATLAPRPYTFHIAASWAGKAEDRRIRKVPFPQDTPIGVWRDKMLSRPKSVYNHDAGEDFFFIQEVCTVPPPPPPHPSRKRNKKIQVRERARASSPFLVAQVPFLTDAEPVSKRSPSSLSGCAPGP